MPEVSRVVEPSENPESAVERGSNRPNDFREPNGVARLLGRVGPLHRIDEEAGAGHADTVAPKCVSEKGAAGSRSRPRRNSGEWPGDEAETIGRCILVAGRRDRGPPSRPRWASRRNVRKEPTFRKTLADVRIVPGLSGLPSLLRLERASNLAAADLSERLAGQISVNCSVDGSAAARRTNSSAKAKAHI
jgi:hypothetical protein